MERMTSTNMRTLNWGTVGRFLFCVAVLLSTQFARAEAKVSLVTVDSKLQMPFGIDFDQTGAMYVIEYEAHQLIKVKDGRAEIVAGKGRKGLSGGVGPATTA